MSRIHENIHRRIIYLEQMKNKYNLSEKIILFSDNNKIEDSNDFINKITNNKSFSILWNNKVITITDYQYNIN